MPSLGAHDVASLPDLGDLDDDDPVSASSFYSLIERVGVGAAGSGSGMNSESCVFLWEKQVDALCIIAMSSKPPLMTVDELRRRIESLEPSAQTHLSYYAKWACALLGCLRERGLVKEEDIARELGITKASETGARETPFAKNDTVRVKSFDFACTWRKPHLRTPGYIFGQRGVVEEFVGCYANPELVAFADPKVASPKCRLYRVRFLMRDIWTPKGADFGGEDSITAEVYEPWLELDDGSATHGDDGAPAPKRTKVHHHHEHHDHGDHKHVSPAETEENAVNREGAPKAGQHLAEATIRLAVDVANLATKETLRAAIERTESAGQSTLGARIVAKAWCSPEFKARLLEDAPSAIKEAFGAETSNDTAPTKLIVVANSPNVRHLVVCTLCSCYPRTVLGHSPSWYRSRHYRAQAARDPRAILRMFGSEPDASTRVEVHDATADCRFLVLPERPSNTEEMSEDELSKLVTRDSMIGVALCCL